MIGVLRGAKRSRGAIHPLPAVNNNYFLLSESRVLFGKLVYPCGQKRRMRVEGCERENVVGVVITRCPKSPATSNPRVCNAK